MKRIHTTRARCRRCVATAKRRTPNLLASKATATSACTARDVASSPSGGHPLNKCQQYPLRINSACGIQLRCSIAKEMCNQASPVLPFGLRGYRSVGLPWSSVYLIAKQWLSFSFFSTSSLRNVNLPSP